jgi:hypothetical protein
MKRTRHVLVMTLVATALCADRVATASPDIRAQLQSGADPIARLATKLSATFRRVVPAVRLHQVRHEGVATLTPVMRIIAPLAQVHATRGSLFDYRLPPPSI